MRAYICLCASAHTYIFTPASTREMRVRTHVHKHCLRPYANAIVFFLMQTLTKCLAAPENGRRGPKAASSNFEHKPWKNSKWCQSDDRSALLKHRTYFRTTFIGNREAGETFSRQTELENEQPGELGTTFGQSAGRSAAVPFRNLAPQIPN